MRVVLLGDVGGADGYHVGDEAMLASAIDELRLRGAVEFTVVSSDPASTTERHGVAAVRRIGFRSGPGERRERDRLLAAVFDDDNKEIDGAEAVSAAIAGADALVITGGGNLSSTWPEHIYERVAALGIADAHGVPAVLTSQTLGPDLSGDERALLAGSFGAVRLLGLRERASYELASELFPATPRRLQLDDAVVLADAPVPSFDGVGALADGFVSLTINALGAKPYADARLEGLTTLVRRIREHTGLPVAFLPHVNGDAAVGVALRDRLKDEGFVVAPVLDARSLVALTRRAAVTISTRYHGIVFGLAAGVPCLAIYQDHYTLTKLEGALEHAGLAGWRLPINALATDLPFASFGELWSRRKEISEHLAMVTAGWAAMQQTHWDDVWGALTGPALRTLAAAAPPVADSADPKLDALAAINTVGAEQLRTTASVDEWWRETFGRAERYAHDLEGALASTAADLEAAIEAATVAHTRVDHLEARLAAVDLRRAEVEASNAELLDETRRADASARTARALVAELRQQLDREIVERDRVEQALATSEADGAALASEVDAIRATKTFRWTKGSRERYRRIRSLLLRVRG
jgi:polysaccharide pyruvyl transferase WcaK-like protein